MHRSYQSVLPTSNKLLQQKWDSTYYNEHRRKVKDMKSMVDTKPPKTYMHLHLKLKKLQLEEERLATIERDNRILLEKMSSIMRTRGRIDNRNDYEYKSLNREKRMRELLRITRENQEILRRINTRQPEYDHEEWERDWEEKQKYMDSIAAYPRDWWKEDDKQENGSRTSSRQNSSRKEKSNDQKNEKDEENKNEESKQNKEEQKNNKKEQEQEKNNEKEDKEEQNKEQDTEQTAE